MGIMWKGEAMAYFNALTQYLLVQIDENHEKIESPLCQEFSLKYTEYETGVWKNIPRYKVTV
jgi:hypothetical protein